MIFNNYLQNRTDQVPLVFLHNFPQSFPLYHILYSFLCWDIPKRTPHTHLAQYTISIARHPRKFPTLKLLGLSSKMDGNWPIQPNPNKTYTQAVKLHKTLNILTLLQLQTSITYLGIEF